MSRSYRHRPFIGIACTDKTAKKRFNRRFRRTVKDDFPSGSAYRKYNETYDISDGKSYIHDEKDMRK